MIARRALAACLLVLAAPAAAHAAPAGFSDPEPVGSGEVRQPAAAVGADGTLAVVWGGGGFREEAVSVARRPRGGTWRQVRLGGGADVVREPQVAVLRDGTTLVAWPEARREDMRLRYAVAPSGAPFGAVRTLARVGSAYGSGARLAALDDGRALLVWRDAIRGRGVLRYAIAGASGRFGAPRSAGEDGAFPAAVALPGGGALLAWAARIRTSRGLRFAQLAAGAQRLGPARTASRDSAEGARLAAGPDGDVLLSWRSRRHRTRLYAREVAPALRAARVLTDGTLDLAHLAIGAGGAELALWRGFDQGYREFAGTADAAGDPFAAAPLDEGSHAMVAVGWPAFTGDGVALALWTQSREQLGPATYDVLVAVRAPGESGFGAPQALAGDLQSNDGAGLALAQSGSTLLAAWPGPPGTGLRVAVREAA
ncbi:MAG TPA: hypothetical protein VGJ70_18475 [Solirubrobacteraceae bacterium]